MPALHPKRKCRWCGLVINRLGAEVSVRKVWNNLKRRHETKINVWMKESDCDIIGLTLFDIDCVEDYITDLKERMAYGSA